MIVKRGNRKRSDPFELRFYGKKLEKCVLYKYVGVHIDENLSWKTHVSYLCEKLSKMCGVFSKLRHCCKKDLLRVIYFALVKSHLQYCNIIWGNAKENILKPLIKLQEKILRIMCFVPFDHGRTDNTLKDLKLLNLNQLNKLGKANR